jgi:hypothetical protein
MTRSILLLPLFALAAGCAAGQPSQTTLKYQASEAARLDKALAGLTPGKAKSCIDLRDANGPESYGDTTLLFRVGRKLVYRTETIGSCRNVGAGGRALITHTYGSGLCRGDTARAADLAAGFETGSCAMGDFVPYKGS